MGVVNYLYLGAERTLIAMISECGSSIEVRSFACGDVGRSTSGPTSCS